MCYDSGMNNKIYVVKKVIVANSINDALSKEKTAQIIDISLSEFSLGKWADTIDP